LKVPETEGSVQPVAGMLFEQAVLAQDPASLQFIIAPFAPRIRKP
jgi:hypothetical protein